VHVPARQNLEEIYDLAMFEFDFHLIDYAQLNYLIKFKKQNKEKDDLL
jgi:hypothetical protein